MTEPDPFDTGVARVDGKPQIIPLNSRGKPDLKKPLVTYDRASDAAGWLDDGYGVAKWQIRHAAIGIAISPDLAGMAGALGTNPDEFTPADKRNLDAIIDRAHDRSGGNVKADYGTAIHSLTEPGNAGHMPEHMVDDVMSYRVALDEAAIEVDATEVFIVNDELMVAGTFDHVYRFTRDVSTDAAGKPLTINGQPVTIPAGTRVIGDKKTGALHIDACVIQEAIYAYGKAYDHNTGERTALDVSTQWGIVAHIPRLDGKTTLHLVDLAAGWEGAKLARGARDFRLGARKRMSAPLVTYKTEPPPSAPAPAHPAPTPAATQPAPTTAPPADPFAGIDQAAAQASQAARQLVETELGGVDVITEQIKVAPSGDDVRALWTKYHSAWTKAHTETATNRLRELGEPIRGAA